MKGIGVKMNNKLLVILMTFIIVLLSFSGCTQQENAQNSNTDENTEEKINLEIIDTGNRDIEDYTGAEGEHLYSEYRYALIYNQGVAGYATVHAKIVQQSGDDIGKIWEDEQDVYFDAGETKEITFFFRDFVFGESYGPEPGHGIIWVEYK